MPNKRDSKRISRLRLTLGSPYRVVHTIGSDSEEQKRISTTGSQWTLSAGPASAASVYSQESYTDSPVPFCSAKLDRRRFALAIQSANWEGGWSAPIHDSMSPEGATFVLDLHSATLDLEIDGFISNKSEDTLLKKTETETFLEDKKASQAHVPMDKEAKKPRGKSVFGRMFSRPLTHPARTEAKEEEGQHLLPALPPQIDISIPSPGIKGVHDMAEPEITPTDLVRSIQSAKVPNHRATMPSGWKACRPPSPVPNLLKKQGNRKRKAGSVSLPINHSPVPPLPTRPRESPIPPVGQSPKEDSPSDEVAKLLPRQGQKSWGSSWTESLQARVKARAMKSAYYAVVLDDVPSPPTSAM